MTPNVIIKIIFFQILVAGSVAIQVALCPDDTSFWRNGDIDIFVTCAAAPHARDRLTDNCHLYYVGKSERYEHSEENSLICFQRVENYSYVGDPMGRSFVQLIVGKTGIDDATALLDSFDLDICKCAITANRFIIPRPFQTFLFETMLQPALKSLLHKFIEAWDAEMTPINDRLYYSGPFPAIPESVNAFNIVHSIPASVWLAVGFATLTSELTDTACSIERHLIRYSHGVFPYTCSNSGLQSDTTVVCKHLRTPPNVYE